MTSELKPYPYQEIGIKYALEKQRVILGDDVGCGKTVQAIKTVVISNQFPCIVICPATLKINWQREWAMWARDKRVMILSDIYRYNWMDWIGARHDFFGDDYLWDVVICNYESLKKYFVVDGNAKPRLPHIKFSPYLDNFKSVIVDEIHRCKDGSTQSAKLTKGISCGKQMILGLTGTPVVNKPIDLLPQLAIINQLSSFGGATYFRNVYSKGKNNAQLLKTLKDTCYIRREKSEVLTELPDKIKTKLFVELSNRELYDQAKDDIAKFILEYEGKVITRNARAQMMVKIIKLRQISAMGKLSQAREYIDNAINNIGKKVIVFIWHTSVADSLTEMYPNCVKVVGGQSQAERQYSIDRFQQDKKVKVIVCNIKAAGVGITLTAASIQLFIELPWTSADLVQAEGRAYRNGQKDSVNCVYLMGENTIDSWVYGKTETKRIMSNEISGSKELGVNQMEALRNKAKNNLVTGLFSGKIKIR